jgi:hypothetical protein
MREEEKTAKRKVIDHRERSPDNSSKILDLSHQARVVRIHDGVKGWLII